MNTRLTKEQAVVITVMTGVFVLHPRLFKAEIEKALGRVIQAEEWATPSFKKELVRVYSQDFEAMWCLDEPPKIETVRSV